MAGNDETLKLKVETDTKAAERDLKALQKTADKLEDDPTKLKVEADTSQAESGLGGISDLLGRLPGPAGEAAEAIGGMGGGLGAAATGAGALGVALFAAADAAADMAIEAETMATLTGDSVEAASALQAVWKSTGADVNDLNDIILQMQGALSTNEDAAKQLGININDGKTGAQRFTEVMEKLRNFTGSAAEKSQLMSQLLGEEGARQGAKFLAVVGDIDEAVGNVSDSQLITDDEVEKALEFKRTMTEVKQVFGDMAVTLGQEVMPALSLLGEAVTKANAAVEGKSGNSWLDAFGQAIGDTVNPLRNITQGFDAARGKGEDSADKVTKAWGKPVAALDKAADAAGRVTTGAKDLATAFSDGLTSAEDWAGAVDHLADVYGEAEKAQAAFYDAQRAAVDSQYAAEEAAQDLIDTIVGYKDAVKDAEGNVSKLKDVQDATRESAIGYADAQVRAKQETALAAGEYRTAEQDHRDYIGALVESTTYMEGPQKQAVLDYIARLEGIPPEKVSEIIADPDYQSIDETATALDNAAKPRTAPITVEIKGLPGFYSALQAASRAANVSVTPGSAPASTVGPSQQAVAVAPVRAGGTVTNNITLNTRATAGRELTRELNRWARLNGRSRG